MKKMITLSLASLLLLTGCASIDKLIKGDKTDDTSINIETTEEIVRRRLKELNKESTYFPQLSSEVADNEAEVKLSTSKGDIRIKLFPKQAPLAVENFLTHAKNGYYNGLTFHRVIKDFMIQSGDPEGTGAGGQSIWSGKDTKKDAGNGFVNEISEVLYHIRGALAMANAGADTNGSQFYIVQNSDDWSDKLSPSFYPNKIIDSYKNGGYPSLDGSYTVFGQVIEGMDIVDSIANTQTDDNDKPLEPITITSIEIIKDYNFNN